MSHGNVSRWRRAVAMLIWPETHAGIPQQCLGWMKRRGAAPGCHEKGEKRRQLNIRASKAKLRQTLPPPAGPEDCLSTASQSSWEQKTFKKSRYGDKDYANTAFTLAYLHRACFRHDLGFVLDILNASSSVFFFF